MNGVDDTDVAGGAREVGRPGASGRAVIVTGGSRGLGRETTLRLAAQGCDLAVCGRDAASLEAVAEEVRARHGRTLHTERLDVLDESALAAFVRESAARLGRVHGLVTVAGGARGTDLRGTEPSDWDLTSPAERHPSGDRPARGRRPPGRDRGQRRAGLLRLRLEARPARPVRGGEGRADPHGLLPRP